MLCFSISSPSQCEEMAAPLSSKVSRVKISAKSTSNIRSILWRDHNKSYITSSSRLMSCSHKIIYYKDRDHKTSFLLFITSDLLNSLNLWQFFLGMFYCKSHRGNTCYINIIIRPLHVTHIWIVITARILMFINKK